MPTNGPSATYNILPTAPRVSWQCKKHCSQHLDLCPSTEHAKARVASRRQCTGADSAASYVGFGQHASKHTHTHHVELAGHQPLVLSGHIPLLTSVSCTDHWHVAHLATSRCATTTIGHAPHSLPTRAWFETPQLLLLHARMPTHSSSGPYDGLG